MLLMLYSSLISFNLLIVDYFFSRFLERCRTAFPFKNSQECYLMATEKVHRLMHTPNDVARFGHYLNYCCEAPEKGHRSWVGLQGAKTNQDMKFSLH